MENGKWGLVLQTVAICSRIEYEIILWIDTGQWGLLSSWRMRDS